MLAAAAGSLAVFSPFLRAPRANASIITPRVFDFTRSSSITSCSSSSLPKVSSCSGVEQGRLQHVHSDPDDPLQLRRSDDWANAKAYKENGVIFEGRIEGYNSGGLLIRFFSLKGFLPYPLLSPSHSCQDPGKSIIEIAKVLVGTTIAAKVIEANGEEMKLIFSEKEASWSKYAAEVIVGDVLDGIVGSVEDYGAFIHLQFPDGLYHLTGLVHVTEVSWDLVQDVRDFLKEGDKLKVKVKQVDRDKSRIALSIKQLEEDPLLETLDKVITQGGEVEFDLSDMTQNFEVQPLPGLEVICKEILLEEGIIDVRFGRQGLEKRVVSQDLELWLSNVPAKDNQYTILARAGRQVQELYVRTKLSKDDVKTAIKRVMGRIP